MRNAWKNSVVNKPLLVLFKYAAPNQLINIKSMQKITFLEMCFAASLSSAFRISMDPKFLIKMLNNGDNIFKVPTLFDILIYKGFNSN